MVLTKTPICNFGEKPHSFKLKGVDEKIYKLEDCKGNKGTIIMFICNHCPYVKAIVKDLIKDVNSLKTLEINAVAIIVRDPPSSMFLAAPKNLFGLCSALASTPPVKTLPELGTTAL